MEGNAKNFMMFRNLKGFSLNFSDEWFYEGDYVDITHTEYGNIKNALITGVDSGKKLLRLKNTAEVIELSIENIVAINSCSQSA